jgi:hypothetical protein
MLPDAWFEAWLAPVPDPDDALSGPTVATLPEQAIRAAARAKRTMLRVFMRQGSGSRGREAE